MRRIKNIWYKAGIIVITIFIMFLGVFLYLLIVKIDVVDDSTRRISLNASQYHVGDTVIITASAKKLQNVTGKSSRYIVCDNPNGSISRFNIGESIANRPAKFSRNSIYLKIPNSIPTVPTKCLIEFSTDYGIFYKHELSHSKKFEVLPAQTQTTVLDTRQVVSDNNNQVLENSPKDGNIQTSITRAISNPDDQSTEEQIVDPPHQDGLRGTVNNVFNFVKGIF